MACRRLACVLVALLTIPAASWAERAAETVAVPESGLTESGLTLRECYALALKRSETIAIQAELIKETEGRFLQALSGILPEASYVISEQRQDGTGASAFTLRHVPQHRFFFSQPLFAGFKEFAAMAGSRAERRERKHEKARAEQLLLIDVADAFHLLLQQREDLEALETIRVALVERLDELRQREQLGRSRPSEVVSAEAQLRRTEAEVELARRDETVSRQLLEFLTGLTRIEAVSRPDLSLPALDVVEAYAGRAALRPDVRAAEEAWQVARKEVLVVQAKLWPTVDLEGNYYTERVGAAAAVEWDATLKVDVPLFQGGEAVGGVKEAAAAARRAKLEFERAERSAALDIRDTYAKLQAAIARSVALGRALEAADQSYRLQVEDYRLNLVSNLDVLRELEQLQDARRDAIQAQHEVQRLYWQLQVATGETL